MLAVMVRSWWLSGHGFFEVVVMVRSWCLLFKLVVFEQLNVFLHQLFLHLVMQPPSPIVVQIGLFEISVSYV